MSPMKYSHSGRRKWGKCDLEVLVNRPDRNQENDNWPPLFMLAHQHTRPPKFQDPGVLFHIFVRLGMITCIPQDAARHCVTVYLWSQTQLEVEERTKHLRPQKKMKEHMNLNRWNLVSSQAMKTVKAVFFSA